MVNKRKVPFAIQTGTIMIPVTMQDIADIATGALMCSNTCLVRTVFDIAMSTSSANDVIVDFLRRITFDVRVTFLPIMVGMTQNQSIAASNVISNEPMMEVEEGLMFCVIASGKKVRSAGGEA